jgi:peptidoglycan/LPS O-acetylase OafA/YrhL
MIRIPKYTVRNSQVFRFQRLKSSSEDLLHLDLLRFVASAGIIAHHSIEYFLRPADREWLLQKTMGLALFVDLFFVISGYVIAYVYSRKVSSLAGYGEFLQRRVGRLVPLHWLTLAISISVWTGFRLLGVSGQHTPSFEISCIAQTAVFLHAFVGCGNGIAFNGVSWSIGAEMAMYALFPIFAFAGTRSRIGFGLAAIATFGLVASYGISTSIDDPMGSWVNITPALRALPSFLIGVALFYNRDLLKKLPAPKLLLSLFAPALLAFMLTGAAHLLVLALVYAVVASAAAADINREVSKAIKRFAPLGQLTYSLYMWHTIVILVLMNALGDKLLHAGPALMSLIALVCYTSIFVLAYFSYFAIETPARRWIDSFPIFRPKLQAAANAYEIQGR